MNDGTRREPRTRARQQINARVAGAAYLVTIIAGMFAEVFARATIRVPGDAATTAANILTHDSLYRLSIFADLVMLASYVVVTALLYELFKPGGRSLSLIAAFLSLTGIALLSAATGLLAAPPILLGDAPYLATFASEQRAALAYATLHLHGSIYGFTGIFFGLYCLAIGRLVVRSRLLPRLIGWLMALAGATFVLNSALQLVAPAVARQVPDLVTGISLLGEGALAMWLGLFGTRTPVQPHRVEGAM